MTGRRAKDKPPPLTRSQVMARVKSKNTTPELKVRAALWRAGLRYRLHRADLPGKPDLTFVSRRVAVFVHGCFWHGHECPRGARMPKDNADYWRRKIERNRARDQQAATALTALGWRVLTVWECEIKDPARLDALAAAIRSSPASAPPSAPPDRHSAAASDRNSVA